MSVTDINYIPQPENCKNKRLKEVDHAGRSLFDCVHAGVSIRAEDRKGLERLLRYAGRPPISADRLEQLPDGRLSYRLKTPWKNGATHVLFEPLEFMARLAVAPARRRVRNKPSSSSRRSEKV
jgi:putative transposase